MRKFIEEEVVMPFEIYANVDKLNNKNEVDNTKAQKHWWSKLWDIYKTLNMNFKNYSLFMASGIDKADFKNLKKNIKDGLLKKSIESENIFEICVVSDALAEDEYKYLLLKKDKEKLNIEVCKYSERKKYLTKKMDKKLVVHYIGIDANSSDEQKSIDELKKEVALINQEEHNPLIVHTFIGEPGSLTRNLAIYHFDIVRLFLLLAYTKGEELVKISEEDQGQGLTIFNSLANYSEQTQARLQTFIKASYNNMFRMAA